MNFQTRSNTEHLEGSAVKRSRCSAVHDEIPLFAHADRRIQNWKIYVMKFS